MTLNELYVLNSAIDGQDIYSIPAFSENRLSQMSVDLIKESMIEKGYLEDNSTLSLQGASEVRRIEQFKKAIKYITILDLIIGCMDGEKGILLNIKNNVEYNFSLININEVINILIEVFPDLLADDGLEDTKCFSSENTNEFYFLSNGKKYYYDCDKHMLYEKNSKELKGIIRVRIKGDS